LHIRFEFLPIELCCVNKTLVYFSLQGVGGFDLHVKRDHNMWNYLYYTMYLQNVQESEHSYHESYLRNMLVKKMQMYGRTPRCCNSHIY